MTSNPPAEAVSEASPAKPEGRDADRTRQMILDAAESLFADRGFRGTSLEDIGQAAGVSRGTPGYFFGSKDALYREVLDRAIATRREVMETIAEAASELDQPPEDTIIAFVVAYLDFLAGDSNFLRLVDRESLSEQPRVYDSDVQLDSLRRGVDRVGAQLQRAGQPHDPRQLFITSLALCEWPFVHAPLVGGLGFDPSDPAFIEARKAHIIEVIRAWLRSPTGEKGTS